MRIGREKEWNGKERKGKKSVAKALVVFVPGPGQRTNDWQRREGKTKTEASEIYPPRFPFSEPRRIKHAFLWKYSTSLGDIVYKFHIYSIPYSIYIYNWNAVLRKL